MATYGRGLICLCLTEERCDELGLHLLASSHESRHGTAYTNPIDAREGITTGVSAARPLAHDPQRGRRRRPGRLHRGRSRAAAPRPSRRRAPARRADRGRGRSRPARGACAPPGVVCEVMNDDGTMARVPDLVRYCEKHAARDGHRRRPDRVPARTEKLVERVTAVRLPTEHGEFTVVAFRELVDGEASRRARQRRPGRLRRTFSSASTPNA